LLSKVKEESTARAALQMKLSGKIDDSTRALKSLVAAELKKESTARKELEQCVKELIQKVDDMQRTNEELIAENKRLNLLKRQLPVKLALKIHRKTTSTDEVKPIEITDLSEQKAMAGA
jgi:regulator of replication initiation timing